MEVKHTIQWRLWETFRPSVERSGSKECNSLQTFHFSKTSQESKFQNWLELFDVSVVRYIQRRCRRPNCQCFETLLTSNGWRCTEQIEWRERRRLKPNSRWRKFVWNWIFNWNVNGTNRFGGVSICYEFKVVAYR